LRLEKFTDSNIHGPLYSRTEYRSLLSQMKKSASINRNSRPKFISKNHEFPITTLEDLSLCLSLFNYPSNQYSEIARAVSEAITTPIRNMTNDTTRIVDVDGSELSVDGLAKKYFQIDL
jgi:hypothetical protein